MQYSRKTYNKKKYIPYSKSNETYTYAFHDIDMHKEEIMENMHCFDLDNYFYCICNPDIKPNEINAPEFEDGRKIFLTNGYHSEILIVNNSEKYVSPFAVAVNPIHNFNWEVVQVYYTNDKEI